METDLTKIVAAHLRNPQSAWSLGTFGVIAEFMHDPGEPVDFEIAADRVQAATDRGAIRLRLDGSIVAVAYETPGKAPDRWSHAVAVCLPKADCAGNQRTMLTELGPDAEAVRPQDRDAILFDMGLGTLQVDACVRVSDPAMIERFRAGCGSSLFEPGNPLGPAMPELSPHRVFTCRFGRIEVFQPIPPADGKSPEGPHTHVLPRLFKSGQTHSSAAPIPAHLVPCAHIHPANPLVDIMGEPKPFDRKAFADFQALLEAFGDPELVALKKRLIRALERGEETDASQVPDGRHNAAALKLAKRQAAALAAQSG